MNGARRRRSHIQLKARLARIKRLWGEHKKRPGGQDIVMPEPVLRARVYLKIDEFGEGDFSTSVVVDLPRDNPTKRIRDMQTWGFWVPRPHLGVLKYIAPQQIRQVHMEIS